MLSFCFRDKRTDMIHKLITLLMNHPQFGPRLVQTLSESYPIRRAARFTAYLYLRGRHALEEGFKNEVAQNAMKGTSSFKDTFQAELRKGFEEAKRKKY